MSLTDQVQQLMERRRIHSRIRTSTFRAMKEIVTLICNQEDTRFGILRRLANMKPQSPRLRKEAYEIQKECSRKSNFGFTDKHNTIDDKCIRMFGPTFNPENDEAELLRMGRKVVGQMNDLMRTAVRNCWKMYDRMQKLEIEVDREAKNRLPEPESRVKAEGKQKKAISRKPKNERARVLMETQDKARTQVVTRSRAALLNTRHSARNSNRHGRGHR